jgi:hypothetical protein
MKEYSYFLADGLSLEALDSVRESAAELARLKTKLCTTFGADDLMGGYRKEEGRFHFTAFHFRAGQKVPQGWKINNEQRDREGNLMGTFALPAPNTADAFHMASMGGLMERASRHDCLEGVFGTDRLMRPHGAGTYETAFVRQSMIADSSVPTGKTWGAGYFGGAKTSPGSTTDPILAVELDGKTYFRVPNKLGTEEPIVTPPDAIPMSYEKMLEADKAETDRRNKPAPPLGWLC